MMTRHSLRLAALVSVLSFGPVALPARAAGDANGKGKRVEPKARRARAVPTVVVIDQDGHRRVVREFFASEPLPPGLAKRESLPPGLSKQLREKGRLPPGLQKRFTTVSPALSGRLPAVPAYYTRYFAGRDLVVVDTRTNRIVSVIRDILQ